MQVLLNLSHDPTTADSTQAALKSVGARVNERLPALVRAVVGPDRSDAEVERIGRFFYNVVRGLALDQELLEAMPIEHSTTEEFDAQRAELVAPGRFSRPTAGRAPDGMTAAAMGYRRRDAMRAGGERQAQRRVDAPVQATEPGRRAARRHERRSVPRTRARRGWRALPRRR